MNKKHDKDLFKKRMTIWILALICMVLMSFTLTNESLSNIESKKCKEIIKRFDRYTFKDGAEVYYYDKEGNVLHMETYRDLNNSRVVSISADEKWPEGSDFCIVANIHVRGKSDELTLEVITKKGIRQKTRSRVPR